MNGSQLYHVKFDDGDEDKKIHEIHVMPNKVSWTRIERLSLIGISNGAWNVEACKVIFYTSFYFVFI